MGEGGGQVLRSSLALSLSTGRPFRIFNIRANRKKSGLLSQHLRAVMAASAIGRAETTVAKLGSSELTFEPREVTPGSYRFSVGSAGSSILVLQTVLVALATARGPSTLTLEGGTHNPFAPTFDFLDKVFLPCLARMGPKVTCRLFRPGFFPSGGGRFTASIEPSGRLSPLELTERGKVLKRKARAYVSKIPQHVGHREVKAVAEMAGWGRECLEVVNVKNSPGPGNTLSLEVSSERITEVFTGFGEKGVPAEKIAKEAVAAMQRYLEAGVPVGPYLADQLLVPMALAGGGSFFTLAPTLHTRTNIEVIKKFLDVDISVASIENDVWEIRLSS